MDCSLKRHWRQIVRFAHCGAKREAAHLDLTAEIEDSPDDNPDDTWEANDLSLLNYYHLVERDQVRCPRSRRR